MLEIPRLCVFNIIQVEPSGKILTVGPRYAHGSDAIPTFCSRDLTAAQMLSIYFRILWAH